MIELVMAVLLIIGALIIVAFLGGAVMLALAALACIGGLALNVAGWTVALVVSARNAAVAAFDP